MDGDAVNELSEKIAAKAAEKTVHLLKLEKEKEEAEKVPIDDTWIDGDTLLTCGPCTKYSDRDDIPRQYSRQRKGNFGIIEKTLPGGEMRRKSHVMQSIKRHVESSLHIYCCIRA